MRRAAAVVALALAAAAVGAAGAQAAPAWRIDALSNTTAAPGGTLTYVVQLSNVGDVALSGRADPIELTATLPAGLAVLSGPAPPPGRASPWSCPGLVAGVSQSLACENVTDNVARFRQLKLTFEAAVDPAAAGVVTSAFAVVGGHASDPLATTVDPTRIAAVPPPFGIDAFDGTVSDVAGAPYTQAAGHPASASVSIDFNTTTDPAPLKGELWPVEQVRNLLVDLPPGLVGDPTGVAQCTAEQLASDTTLPRSTCPPDAQVGTALVRARGTGARSVYGPLPVFSMVPPPDVPARFGFNLAGTVVTLDAELRSATDYGLSVRVRNVPEALAVSGASLTFWGVPSDPSHDAERACPGREAPWAGGAACASGAPRRAFLRNPTSCTPAGAGLPVTARIDSWSDPGDVAQATFVSHLPPGYPHAPDAWGARQGTTGCDVVPFEPGIAAAPNTTLAGAPSGWRFDVSLPQPDDPGAIAQADLRSAVVRLPEGVRVNPSAADGLAACTPAEVGLDSLAEPTCPDASRIGALTIVTPLLDEPLTGSIFLARPHENPFGTLLAIYLVARGPGLIVKLAGRIDADPATGRLTARFDDVPQLPFSNVRLAFDGGPRAPLSNPRACGAHAVTTELQGWSGASAAPQGGFALSGCAARAFAPGFTAGSESPAAGGSSPFHLRVTRTDADDELGALRIDLPQGLVGRLADAVLCAEGDAHAGTCPQGSRVGSVVAGAGAGPNPFYVTGGRVYVTGPYKGAPFGLSIVVPAVAGPFDLGDAVVRAAIFVDRSTAELRVVSDPLPTILEGIPLQLRDVRVAIDRPGFMVNPTDCSEQRVGGSIEPVGGGPAAVVSERFQAAECRSLPLRPELKLIAGAPGRTARGRSTRLAAVLRRAPGEANLAAVAVTLPATINARLAVVEDACTPEQLDAGRCRQARIGSAVAVTPLLRDPLRGDVYLVRSAGRPLPDIVVALRGQVDFDLVGRVSIPGGKLLRATFDAVPDVPISWFALRLAAGPRGVVGTAARLCSPRARRARARIDMTGQNGAQRTVRQRLAIRGCSAARAR